MQNQDGENQKGRANRRLPAWLTVLVMVFIFGLGVFIGGLRFNVSTNFSQISDDIPADLDYSEVEHLYDRLRKNYDGQLDIKAIYEGLKQGLAGAAGDVYTEYLSPEEAKAFDDDLNGTFSGIGAELSKDEQAIVVVSPIAGFPAEKAGLLPQDVIAEINGESAFDLTLTEAVNKIRGRAGTKVKLTVIRNGSEELEIEITRAEITIPSVESEILDGNIGYLKISRFSEDTYQLAREAAKEFVEADVEGVILDVRNNPGGLLDSSVEVAGLWLPSGTTVLEEKRGGVTVETLEAEDSTILQGMPTVVLINEGSASASEILAGALSDHDAATLLGAQTFGKGSVQQLVNLADGGVLKVTIARWFTPGGKNIDEEGIKPDREVEMTSEDIVDNLDPQRDAAIDFLNR